MIHGSWTCWSAWSTCSRGQRSRSRRCQNPAPQNGGQHCIGDTVEMSSCDEEDLEYLKLVCKDVLACNVETFPWVLFYFKALCCTVQFYKYFFQQDHGASVL